LGGGRRGGRGGGKLTCYEEAAALRAQAEARVEQILHLAPVGFVCVLQLDALNVELAVGQDERPLALLLLLPARLWPTRAGQKRANRLGWDEPLAVLEPANHLEDFARLRRKLALE